MIENFILLGLILYFVCVRGITTFFCSLFSRLGNPLFVAKPRDWTPERHHQTKQGIPTMGGLVFLAVWLVFTIFFAYGPLMLYLPAWWIVASMGALGAYDDWSKVNRRGGISAWAKFICQTISAFVAVGMWYWCSPIATDDLWIPLFNIYLPIGIYMIFWGTLVVISASNAINLTDGLDGLAGTVLSWSFSCLVLIALDNRTYNGAYNALLGLFSHGYYTNVCLAALAIFMGALTVVATMRGFLRLNRHPAGLFMGDTGALAFGALLGLYAVQLNITLLLPLMAIVPVIETLSVMLQVAWFKRYQTRLFKMAPLHHHFELIGYSENQIVACAGLITLLGCLLACIFFYFKN